MKILLKKITVLLLFSSFFATAQSITVSTIDEYNSAIKKVSTGGTIILKNGEWKDVSLNAFGNGTKQNPIIVKAETPGKVLITGDSSLSIYGTYVIVSGLWFKDGMTTKNTLYSLEKTQKYLHITVGLPTPPYHILILLKISVIIGLIYMVKTTA